jgi:hypothetical protein
MAALMALVFVALLGVTHAAFAQELQAPPGVFGFSEAGLRDEDYSNSGLYVRPGLGLVEIVDPAERAAALATVRGVSPVTLGPFGGAYPVARLRVYLGRVAPPESERGSADESQPVLLVSADDRGGRARWWRFAVTDSEYEDGFFTIFDEPNESERIGPADEAAGSGSGDATT